VPTTDAAVRSRGFAAPSGRFAALAAALLASLSLTLAADTAAAKSRDSVRSQSVRAIHAAGTTVKAVQRALGIPADGIYGSQTRRAVRRFQRAHGLTVDGIAGPQTLAALGVPAQSSSADTDTILERIAECESGGDPTMDTGNGYYGKYQFSRATWRSVGGRGNPARASEAEQDRRAARLYRREGTKPWPVCGRRAAA
jgi:peptidoglycan hydrolase-like protein with peptidoglycan-binding domain